jgi:hypothetical protein
LNFLGLISAQDDEQPARMDGGRLVLRYTGAMAATVALWALPPTGLLLLIAGMVGSWTMFLLGIVLNAMLLHVAYAGVRGRIARRWLLLPALVYGAFAFYAGFGFLRARSLRHEIEAQAAVDYARVPARNPALLLVAGDDTFDVSTTLAFALAEIGTDAEIHADGQRWHLAPRAGADCPLSPGESPYTGGLFYEKRVNRGYGIHGRCVIGDDAKPPANAIRVRVTGDRTALLGDDARSVIGGLYLHTDGVRLAAPVREDRYDVFSAGQAIGHAESGHVVHPLPVPLSYFYCFMNTLTGWTCHLGLATLSLPFGVRDGADAYARKAAYLVAVLGLKRTEP